MDLINRTGNQYYTSLLHINSFIRAAMLIDLIIYSLLTLYAQSFAMGLISHMLIPLFVL